MNARGVHIRWVRVGLTIVLAVLLSGMVSASTPPAGPGMDAPTALGADDGTLDVGGEYPSADAPPWGAGGDDLPYTQASVSHFYTKMRAAGYTGAQSFIYGNNMAWETDWKRAALGGSENAYVDNVDIVFFHDHGGAGGMWIPWGHTDTWVVPNDCFGSWGDKDAEWIGVKSCLTLTDHLGWARCMNGLHLLAGMTTVSYGADYGGEWADQLLGWQLLGIWLRAPKTVTQAWFTTCDSNQPSSVRARVIAEHPNHFNDKVWNRGGQAYGDIVDNWYHWIDHACYKPEPSIVDTAMLVTLPAYEVQHRTVNQQYAASIAATLHMSGTLSLSADGQEIAVTDTQGGVTRTLSIATASGGYLYQNLSELWAPAPPGQPLSLPSPDEALTLANNFFLQNEQTLPGSQYRDPSTQHAETESLTSTGKEGAAAGILQTEGVDVMVAYGRSLATGLYAANGAAIEVSVVGPGSATKAYMGGNSGQTASDDPAQGLPIGLVGGWREVAASPGKTTVIQSADKTWNDFLADRGLAVVAIPVAADQIVRKPVSDTLAYYEQPQGVPQKELIPVWAFRADFIKDGAVVLADALVYVPASRDYYPPEVTIIEPANGATVRPGQPVTFRGSASGGFAPFVFKWMAGQNGDLGTGPEITAPLVYGTRPGQGGATQETITLRVINANGQARNVSISVNVAQPTYLPMMLK
jgi:hypothetical protein